MSYRKDNSATCNANSRKWRAGNLEARKDYDRSWYRRNTEKKKEQSRLWHLKNPDKASSKTMRRVARKLNATPIWLTNEQKAQIDQFYWLAKDCELLSGQKYDVDHVVPLQGKDVCGLHVPWNLQILPKDVNIKKGNKHG